MSHHAIITGLLKQNFETTSSQLAMWENIGIWRVAYNKLVGWFTKMDELNLMLKQEQVRLSAKFNNDEIGIQADFFKQVCNHFGIRYKNVQTMRDLDDICAKIESHTIQLLKKSSKGKFTGSDLQDLVKYNIEHMFSDVSKQFDKKSDEEQRKIVSEILDVINDMPPDQQAKLRKELGVDELSDKVVAQAITTGALGVAFAAIVEIAGFSAYIFASKAVASIVGLVGLTLPFAAYSTISSFIAAFANPFLLIPLILGGGYWMTSSANKKIRNAILPSMITQLAVSATQDKDISGNFDAFIKHFSLEGFKAA